MGGWLGSQAERTFAFALSALILYLPANLYPFMTMNLYGRKTQSTLWEGVVELYKEGSWGLAFIVLAASIVVPLFKILILLTAPALERVGWQWGTLARFLDVIGKWAMLDVFIVAALIAIIKLRSWADVTAGTGLFFFCGVVIFTIFASSAFGSRIDEKA
ncbi:MAG: paraquat-inducible protein A [Oligoflexales bacterium]